MCMMVWASVEIFQYSSAHAFIIGLFTSHLMLSFSVLSYCTKYLRLGHNSMFSFCQFSLITWYKASLSVSNVLVNNVRNDAVGSRGSSRKRKEVSKYNRPQITSETEPLAEVNVYDKEVKVVLEMPGVRKEHIRIQAYKNSVEVSSDHPQRKYQVIDIPPVADIKTIRSNYKNGILEIVFKKKDKRREIRIE